MRNIIVATTLCLTFALSGCGGQGNSDNQVSGDAPQFEELQVLKKSKMYEGVDYDKLAEAIAKDQGAQ